MDFTQYLSLDEARKVRVGVIMPNKQVGDLLAAYRPALDQAQGGNLVSRR